MNPLKISCVLFVALLVFSCASADKPNTAENYVNSQPAETLATPAAKNETASDQKLYMDNCAACHKENGTGGKIEIDGRRMNPDNLTTDKIKAFTDEKIARYINNGILDEGMPAFKDKLNDSQVAELIKYIRSDIQKK